jgi:uncharacterized membrane protein YphA (DoxX/SURF4 family)
MALARRLSFPLLAGIFLAGGVDAAREPAPEAERPDRVGPRVLARLPVDVDPAVVVRANGVVQVTAAALLAANVVPRLAAGVLVGSLVPTTIAGHALWVEEPTTRAGRRLQFLKDLGVLGGLLLVVATRGARRDPRSASGAPAGAWGP